MTEPDKRYDPTTDPNVDPHSIEWIIPFDTAEFLGGPRIKYANPLMTLSDGTVVNLNAPGIFDDDETPPEPAS
jgi:hypothetical protein